MWFSVDPSSGIGLADQIAVAVRLALAEGRLSPGDRLPPAREVAAGLEVNMHTVLRAYAALRDEGLLDLRRGRGARVRADVDPATAALAQQIRTLVADASRLGMDAGQLTSLVRKAYV